MSTYGPKHTSDISEEFEWDDGSYSTLGAAKAARSNRINRMRRYGINLYAERIAELTAQPIRKRTVIYGEWEDVQ